jgi:hypothetical protein
VRHWLFQLLTAAALWLAGDTGGRGAAEVLSGINVTPNAAPASATRRARFKTPHPERCIVKTPVLRCVAGEIAKEKLIAVRIALPQPLRNLRETSPGE